MTDLPASAASISAATIGEFLRGPVQRLLDRDDRRIARRLLQELHDDVEALIRMVDDDVLGADRREAVAAEIADPLGKADIVRREHEVGALVHDQPLRFDQPDQSLADEDVVRRNGQPAAQKLAQIGRHAAVDGQPDHAAAAPALQRALEGPHEIFGFLVDLHLAVAQNAEQAIADQPEGLGKQPVDEQQHNLLQQDEAGVRTGYPNEPVDLGRQQHHHVQVAVPLGIMELERQPHAAVGDEREGMGGIDRQRRQDREDVGHEPLGERVEIGGGQLRRIDDRDAGRAQLLAQRPPAVLLVLHQRADAHPDLSQLFGRRQPVIRDRLDAGAVLGHQTGDAHDVEFVHVGGRDCQEAQPLQKRMMGIGRFLQDPPVELQPGQLAVDIPVPRRGFTSGRAVLPVSGRGSCGMVPGLVHRRPYHFDLSLFSITGVVCSRVFKPALWKAGTAAGLACASYGHPEEGSAPGIR